MTMALTRAEWHKAYVLPVVTAGVRPTKLVAQWNCDQSGVARCHWGLIPSPARLYPLNEREVGVPPSALFR